MGYQSALKSARLDVNKLRVVPWPHSLTDHFGHDTRSSYVERFWVSTLGPTTILFLRHCAELLDGADSASVSLEDIAGTLGIGFTGGSSGPMFKTLVRACRFKTARPVAHATLAVRLTLPTLTNDQIQRLPASLRDRHEHFVTSASSGDVMSLQRTRARHVALSLIEYGDDIGEIEVQLARLRLHPAVAFDAARWAWRQHHSGLTADDG